MDREENVNPHWLQWLKEVYCCDELRDLIDRGWVRNSPLGSLTDGRIVTEFNTEYFFVFGDHRPSYVGMHYCPFCGRAVSIDLWNREKKK